MKSSRTDPRVVPKMREERGDHSLLWPTFFTPEKRPSKLKIQHLFVGSQYPSPVRTPEVAFQFKKKNVNKIFLLTSNMYFNVIIF